MPDLSTRLHVNMLERARRSGQIERHGIYGIQWGDPQKLKFLRHVRDTYLLPFVCPDQVAVEIGPGGGRWTRYMLGFGRLYAVDFHQEILDELARNFRTPFLVPLKNNGTDFPGIAPASVDFVFSFGCFVHLDLWIIQKYLKSLRYIIKDHGTIVIHYSDKNKELAKKTASFGHNTPTIMRELVTKSGYVVCDEDSDIFPHSAIMRFSPW